MAQAVGAALGAADADIGIGRRLWPRAIRPVVRPRGHGHGAGLCLFRRRQFLAGDGQPWRLPAVSGGLGALLPVPAGR